MTLGGWIFMSVSLIGVWSLVIWTYKKVLTAPRETKRPPDSLGG